MKIPAGIDNFLPDRLYAHLRKIVQSMPLTYGARSNRQTDPYGHLKWSPIYDASENLADISGRLNILSTGFAETWDIIKQKLGGDYKLVRFYSNSYSYGMDGYFHTDSHVEGDITVIIFICDEWDPDWGGELVAMDKSIGSIYALPAANRAVVIPSNMLHAARAVSRKCRKLRTTLMYKARRTRTPSFEKLSDWLVKHGALDFEHQHGSLHDHLCRVYQLLEPRAELSTAFAGGLHSIYGTNAYQRQLIDPNDVKRGMVADVFGKDAEDLAYFFSIIDRPKCLDHEVNYVVEVALRREGFTLIGPAAMKKLQLIEAANLADQDALGKWPILKEIWHGKE